MPNFSSVGHQTTQIWINNLIPIFATRKAVAPFLNIQSCWADQYSTIDTSSINIRPLVIILQQNILGQQHVALNFLLTTLPNRNFYHKAVWQPYIILQQNQKKCYIQDLKKCNIQRTENIQTENRKTNYRGHSNPNGSPG